MDAVVTAIVGGLLLLVLGWIKLDIGRLADKVDRMDERLSARIAALDERLSSRIESLTERVARIEGRLDERERHP